MKLLRKRGFTLVELMIVIAIIGVLSAALTTQMPRVRESARAMRCKANLRNLAQAAMSEMVSRSSKRYVRASSNEWPREKEVGNSIRLVYQASRGWVSWSNSSGRWPWDEGNALSPLASSMTRSIFYGEKLSSATLPIAYLSITNGAVWSLVGKDLNVYVCDVHRAAAERKTGKTVYRSYVMSWVADDENDDEDGKGIAIGNKSAYQLLFAELPARESWLSHSLSVDGSDSVLDPDKNEYIGFNHKVGQRYASHVAFADGHVAALLEPVATPGAKPSDSDLKKLTEQLCDGEEIDVDLRRKMK